MGIQDRDYWRERYNALDKGLKQDPRYDPRLFRRDRGVGSGPPDVVGVNWPWPYQIAFLTFLVFAIFLVYKFLDRAPRNPPLQPGIVVPHSSQPSSIFYPDRADTAKRQLEASSNHEREHHFEKIAADARHKRDAQWQAFYSPSAFCKDNPATVDCANDFIRARRAFEGKYGQ